MQLSTLELTHHPTTAAVRVPSELHWECHLFPAARSNGISLIQGRHSNGLRLYAESSPQMQHGILGMTCATQCQLQRGKAGDATTRRSQDTILYVTACYQPSNATAPYTTISKIGTHTTVPYIPSLRQFLDFSLPVAPICVTEWNAAVSDVVPSSPFWCVPRNTPPPFSATDFFDSCECVQNVDILNVRSTTRWHSLLQYFCFGFQSSQRPPSPRQKTGNSVKLGLAFPSHESRRPCVDIRLCNWSSVTLKLDRPSPQYRIRHAALGRKIRYCPRGGGFQGTTL